LFQVGIQQTVRESVLVIAVSLYGDPSAERTALARASLWTMQIEQGPLQLRPISDLGSWLLPTVATRIGGLAAADEIKLMAPKSLSARHRSGK
jgi:hypothetical protein